MERKGSPIKILDGEYAGKTGWFDNEKEDTKCFYYVIIHQAVKKNGKLYDKATKVRKENVRALEDELSPSSYLEAVLQQHPKIEKLMAKLCKELAMCGMDNADPNIGLFFMSKYQ